MHFTIIAKSALNHVNKVQPTYTLNTNICKNFCAIVEANCCQLNNKTEFYHKLTQSRLLWCYRWERQGIYWEGLNTRQWHIVMLIQRNRGYYMAAWRYEISLRVKYFQHEKRNFVSPSGHVMFYLLYKHQWNTKSFLWNSFFLRKARFIM